MSNDFNTTYCRIVTLVFYTKYRCSNIRQRIIKHYQYGGYMKYYGVNDLRRMFLEFFESKGHLILKSASLVPHNDKSLLLINSGMAPLKPYFTGQEIPPNRRAASCQKCIRTGDIENVGKTSRHATFFEMLGNFSFGDYFKEDSLRWTWEFLTEVIGIDPERLYPSVYLDDDEAYAIWQDQIGIPADRIYRLGKADNFWEHGAGPCGPCSEVYFDRGEAYGCDDPNCAVGCECDRYMEVWNNVFTQFEGDGKGNYSELDQKNIDTGMGLERLAVAVQGVESIFDVDTLRALREHVCRLSGVDYGTDEQTDISVRVITDHIRSVTFMISDGIMPSNEGRGYVLRRLLRRASRHGQLLNIKAGFLPELAVSVIEGSKDGYPELEEKKDFILQVITKEEAQFDKTINQGLLILNNMIEDLQKENKTVLTGEYAFRLYDTYGFPLDLTKEILEEKQITVDEDGFNQAMNTQRETARAARGVTSYSGTDASVYDQIDPSVTSTFVGYDRLVHESSVIVLASKHELVRELSVGEHGTIITSETPFYATSGGQEADRGIIETESGSFDVEDTVNLLGGKIAHVGLMIDGVIQCGQDVTLRVDQHKRMLTERNHSATHLLHKALKEVLGTHVEQAGSSVNESRLRFDFTHFSAMTAEEVEKVEHIVNVQINAALAVDAKIMPIDEARQSGAQALFGEKYGDEVRVVSMGNFSKELCGGNHVKNTAEIMAFKILSESGIAAGVRRIEAVTSEGLIRYYNNVEERLIQAARLLKTNPESVVDKIEATLKDHKQLKSEVDSLKSEIAKSSLASKGEDTIDVHGIKLITMRVDNVDMNQLRDLGDQLKVKLGEGVVVLASELAGKVNLMATATDEALSRGAHAGNLIKGIAGIVGGGGGGRPNMAQAGGKNPAGIDEALAKAVEVLTEQVK